MSLIRIALAVAALMMAVMPPAAAQDLKVGLRADPTALDPQYQNLRANNQIALQIFDPLVARSDRQQPIPGLAVSWKAISDTIWEFKLRPDVKFQDGSPFTAEDVVFTFDRAAKVPNSPSPFTPITRQVTQIEIVDPLTLRIHTAAPAPLLPFDLSSLPIMSHIAAAGAAPEGKTTAELNRGEGLVGTGPFKFVEWQRGTQLVLARNDSYWGPPPAWQKVILRPLSSAAIRLAALLAGDVDLIEEPPSAELPKLKKNPKIALAEAVSSRLIYIAFDTFAEPSPGIPDTAGKNPLKDKRVRTALGMAIDRRDLVGKVMEGIALAATDFLAWPAFGTRKDTAAERYDPSRSRKLLAEAGFLKGFSLTLGTPNGRYPNDVKVAQAVAGMWSRIGVKTQVEAAAPPAFFKNRDEFRYSAFLAGWNSDPAEMSVPLRSLVATPSPEKGTGGANRGRYSNPSLDAKLEEAAHTVDDKRRNELLQDASKLALADAAVLPLYFELAAWAMRKGFSYAARADQMTLAQFAKPAK